jgi:hypothetical protein
MQIVSESFSGLSLAGQFSFVLNTLISYSTVNFSAESLSSIPKKAWDISQIILAASAAHDLSNTSLETLLLDSIHQYFCEDLQLGDAVSDTLPRLVGLVKRIDNSLSTDILAQVLRKWIKSLQASQLSPFPAILAAEKYNLRELRGEAYYSYMLNISSTIDSTTGVTTLDPDIRLDSNQLRRLLSGSWSLRSYWQRLVLSPPVPSRHSPEDQQLWRQAWSTGAFSTKVLAMQPSDVLGMLDLMKEMFRTEEMPPALSSELTEAAQQYRDEIHSHLSLHFE